MPSPSESFSDRVMVYYVKRTVALPVKLLFCIRSNRARVAGLVVRDVLLSGRSVSLILC